MILKQLNARYIEISNPYCIDNCHPLLSLHHHPSCSAHRAPPVDLDCIRTLLAPQITTSVPLFSKFAMLVQTSLDCQRNLLNWSWSFLCLSVTRFISCELIESMSRFLAVRSSITLEVLDLQQLVWITCGISILNLERLIFRCFWPAKPHIIKWINKKMAYSYNTYNTHIHPESLSKMYSF